MSNKTPKTPEQPAPAEQPPAEQPEIFTVLVQIGYGNEHAWMPGDLVGADELAAIPGCSVTRLLDIGALVRADEA